jgi:HEAT repeat protein
MHAQVAPQSTATDVRQLLTDFANAQYVWQQTNVARALIAAKDRSVISSIEPYLETADRKRRCNAALVIAGLGDERGVDILIRELEDTNPSGRTGEEGPWAGHWTPEAAARRMAVGDRMTAASFLGELRSKTAVPALIDATRDRELDWVAATSLGEIGDRGAVKALHEMLDRPEVEEPGIPVIDHPDRRIWGGYALAALGDPRGFTELRAALQSSEWVWRRMAVWGLGKTLDPAAVPLLITALHDQEVNVRVAAAQELGKIADPSALPALRDSLSNDEVARNQGTTTLAAEARKAIDSIEQRGK